MKIVCIILCFPYPVRILKGGAHGYTSHVWYEARQHTVVKIAVDNVHSTSGKIINSVGKVKYLHGTDYTVKEKNLLISPQKYGLYIIRVQSA